MQKIGCHLSSSKGFLHMGEEAVSIGANTFQFFTRNPRGGAARAADPADAAALRKTGADAVLVGEYLMRAADKKQALDALRGATK